MAQPNLTYELQGSGWAVATFGDGSTVTLSASYLHDTLKDLATSAIDVRAGRSSTVLFMDEPGEMRLELEPYGDEIHYALKSFADWASWGLQSDDDYRLIVQGAMAAAHYRAEVVKILSKIYRDIGTERYKEMWIEHEFPAREFEALTVASSPDTQ